MSQRRGSGGSAVRYRPHGGQQDKVPPKSDGARVRSEELYSILRELKDQAVATDSLFRVPQDACDLVVEKLENRLLAGRPPRKPLAWATKVLRNLLKRGPGKRGLTTDEPHLSKTAWHSPDSSEGEEQDHGPRLPRAWLDEFGARLERELSEKEENLWRAIRAGLRAEALERECDMTEWEVRTRLRRIIEKGKKLLISFPPPLWMTSDGHGGRARQFSTPTIAEEIAMGLLANVSVGAGFFFIFAAFATPTSFVECNAIDFESGTGSLVCDGECAGGAQCREITHTTGVVFCGCDDSESLPECCELARQGNNVATVGDCPSCGTTGDCEAQEDTENEWREYQAVCTGSDS